MSSAPVNYFAPLVMGDDSMIALVLCLAVLVHDGDTFRCNGERVRIAALDCPELPGGTAARDALKAMLRGRVEIERRGRDRYGRTVARVLADGRDVACQMMRLCRRYARYDRANEYGACR